MRQLFAVLALSGSSVFLLPASVVAVLTLLPGRRGFEGRLLGGKVLEAPLLVFALKAMVGRERPLPSETQG